MSDNPYVAFRFPFGFSEGRVATVGGRGDTPPSSPEVEESITTGVRQLVLTEPTERVMLGTFGVGTSKYLFSPLGSTMAGLLTYEVTDQLDIWEQRVNLQSLTPSLNINSSQLKLDMVLSLTDLNSSTALSVTVGFEG